MKFPHGYLSDMRDSGTGIGERIVGALCSGNGLTVKALRTVGQWRDTMRAVQGRDTIQLGEEV
jgi:hypothetical protein